MQPELVKLEFRPRSVRIVGPLLHAGQPVPFLAGRSFAFFFLGRRRLVECSIGMHMADEVNVGRQVREDALTAVALSPETMISSLGNHWATMMMSSRANSGRVR